MGPYSLCPETLIKSMFMAFTSRGIFPTAWAQSLWNRTPPARHMAPISASGWMTPISLWTPITDTSSVHSPIASRSRSRSMRPLGSTGK